MVKPLFGSEGRGLVRVSDPELAWRTFRTLERLHSVLYVQKYVRNPGCDVRVFVLAGEGPRRDEAAFASRGEWRTNVAVGGRPEPFLVDDEVERDWPSERRRRSGRRWRGSTSCPTSMRGVGPCWKSTPSRGGRRWGRRPGSTWPRRSWPNCGTSRDDRRSSPPQFRTARPGRLPARSHGEQAGERPSVPRLRRRPLPRLPPERRGDRRAARSRRLRSGVGRAILESVEATRRLVVSNNTNLGMILLLAPMAACPDRGAAPLEGVAAVLENTTIEDASLVYRAIRLARPGGLGRAEDQDVADEPTHHPESQAMSLAADRDLVARQYALALCRRLRPRPPLAPVPAPVRPTPRDRHHRRLPGVPRRSP